MARRRDVAAPEGVEPEHGPHTLRVWHGTIVGVHGDDVFVELGPRMQGVLSRRRFDEPPAPGQEHDFTLLGQEAGLWALARVEEGLVASWQTMEVTSWVQARVTGTNPGGLELKVGPLHAFMPKSESGLGRTESPKVLVGTTVTVEVIEIDRERQRVLVSRKRVLKKQRESDRTRETGRLSPGTVIQGRVHRLEPYGAFVRFGAGLEGLIHVSNLSDEHVEHAADVLTKGQVIEAKVLTIRQGGKRIALGLKQMHESPWKALERTHCVEQLVAGPVTRALDFGVFVRIAEGVEGLLPNAHAGHGPGRRARDVFKIGQELVCRIVELDAEAERLLLSQLNPDGSRVQPDELLSPEARAALQATREEEEAARTNLGRLLDRALHAKRDDA
jgi:small subunit ribosomal protein S1